MPIFEYKCSKCGFVDEFLESHSSRKKHNCGKCGKGMKKIFSGFSPRMKKTDSTCAKNPSCPQAGSCPSAV